MYILLNNQWMLFIGITSQIHSWKKPVGKVKKSLQTEICCEYE